MHEALQSKRNSDMVSPNIEKYGGYTIQLSLCKPHIRFKFKFMMY